MLVATVSTIISLLLGGMLAYPLARMRFPAAGLLAIAVAATYLVPQTLLFVPMADLINRRKLGDTLTAVMLTYPTLLVPFCAWLLIGYFKTLPKELEEAALIDAASRRRGMTRVARPLRRHPGGGRVRVARPHGDRGRHRPLRRPLRRLQHPAHRRRVHEAVDLRRAHRPRPARPRHPGRPLHARHPGLRHARLRRAALEVQGADQDRRHDPAAGEGDGEEGDLQVGSRPGDRRAHGREPARRGGAGGRDRPDRGAPAYLGERRGAALLLRGRRAARRARDAGHDGDGGPRRALRRRDRRRRARARPRARSPAALPHHRSRLARAPAAAGPAC